MKALVVGGTGPTGPFIVEGLLKRDYQVTILHRGTHEVEFSSPVEHLHGDPHFIETLEEILGSRTFDLVICTYGRLRLVSQVMKGRTPRFIGIGAQAYRALVKPPRGPVGIPIPIPEDTPFNLDSDFEKFSYLIAISEQEVMRMHSEGHYSATMFRYPRVFGPRQPTPSEWSIIKRILDGRKRLILPCGGLIIPSMGYAENVAHAVMLAVDKPEESGGNTYNIRDEKLITVRERIELISRVMNHEWEFIDMPGSLAKPSHPYVNRLYHSVVDITKIKNELGYRDLVPLEEGIRRTVNWYLDNPPKPGGHMEKNLRDPFDYETEDKIIDTFMRTADAIKEIPFTLGTYYHPMPHPKKAGEQRDFRGR
ncbi:NAD-dependent epimerase/dehydratase family protein [Thermodesulfobacteriota bacterium]